MAKNPTYRERADRCITERWLLAEPTEGPRVRDDHQERQHEPNRVEPVVPRVEPRGYRLRRCGDVHGYWSPCTIVSLGPSCSTTSRISSTAGVANPTLHQMPNPEVTVRAAILGCGGQLGRALSARLPGAVLLDLSDLDIADGAATSNFSWSGFDVVINTAAYTAVDKAETPEGRVAAWQVNATGVATWRGRHVTMTSPSSTSPVSTSSTAGPRVPSLRTHRSPR